MAVSPSGNASVDGLLSNREWLSGSVTWSDPRSRFDYAPGYDSDLDGDGLSAQFERFSALNARQAATARSALEAVGAAAGFAVEGFSGLSLRYAGADRSSGDLRLANTGDAPTAYAYLPEGGDYGGDVWFGGSGRDPRPGNHDHLTVLHEIGHALGLKHPHEIGRFGPVPLRHDLLELTVMSYRAYAGDPEPGDFRFEEWGAPQTYMMLDIAALQHLYGADFSVNAGNTTYRWIPTSGCTWVDGRVAVDPGANRIFATVWDGGGRDRFDLSGYASDLRLDLRPGRHSVFDDRQCADLGGGPNDGYARGNIFNALQFRGDARSLIENADGGSGDDLMIGNAGRNRLSGGDGADRLDGDAGRDRLAGGAEADVFAFRFLRHSAPGRCDEIVRSGGAAFEGAGRPGGDRIDLRAIDADVTRPGDQAFVLDARGAGRLWVTGADGASIVRASTDADARPEFELTIRDASVRPGDYEAFDFLL